MIPVALDQFFDPDKIEHARRVAESTRGRVIAIGTGATLLMPACDLLIYVDVARWEIQQRQRRKQAPNLGLANASAAPGQLYKRAFFLDWRAADQRRHEIFEKIDFWIDGNLPERPADARRRYVPRGACQRSTGGRFAWCRFSIRAHGAASGCVGILICLTVPQIMRGALTACLKRTAWRSSLARACLNCRP